MTTTPITHSTVRNGAIELAVQEQGNPSGETLVLVHGWPDTHELWHHVVPLLADTFRIISYDTRGAGASTVPTRLADYRLPLLADDFFHVIDAVSPTEKVHVLAHDWGGIEVWEAVASLRAAERIASFTVTSGPNLDVLGSWAHETLSRPTPRNLSGPLKQVIASYYTGLFQLPKLPEFVLRRGLAQRWARFLGVFDGLDPAQVRTASTLPDDMANGVNRYRANIAPKLRRPEPRTISIPVQAVINQRDRAVLRGHYEHYDRFVPRLTRTPLDSGHWAPFSHPAELAAATRDFAAQHPARPGSTPPAREHQAGHGDS
ncbi:alpha/beta fold hydrolase [Hoyosella sp. G463]|uniref:Alpha/beta fold hydrolase n=1 Tax=Lolliginicoccus lacisalsi TaxID=2742202 RepID=A0A927JB76_9ACTN|nr:alpha/beta fold hydrolase [Lolliginicoccus lacisalsi]MBD8505979.1 alpha/beta fold hydrolase [Lolliginicoccus lacisalsi]